MAFKKVMTGGACQADGQQTGLNQNAFTNMIDNFITGDAQARYSLNFRINQSDFLNIGRELKDTDHSNNGANKIWISLINNITK
jgi:hypothetical protein